MPNYYTQLSFAIHDITVQEAEWLKAELEGACFWCPPEYEFSTDTGGTVLWLHEDTACDLNSLADMLQQFLFLFRPTDSIGFSWADTCSKPRVDSFGGGAVFITAVGQEWISLWQWLKERGKDGV